MNVNPRKLVQRQTWYVNNDRQEKKLRKSKTNKLERILQKKNVPPCLSFSSLNAKLKRNKDCGFEINIAQ